MSSPRHVLILGGNGRIGRLLTQILLKKSWSVTSLIRTAKQIKDLEPIADGLPGKLTIAVHDLEKVDSQEKAAVIINDLKPDSIVWTAGMSPRSYPRERPLSHDTGAGATGSQDRVCTLSPSK